MFIRNFVYIVFVFVVFFVFLWCLFVGFLIIFFTILFCSFAYSFISCVYVYAGFIAIKLWIESNIVIILMWSFFIIQLK